MKIYKKLAQNYNSLLRCKDSINRSEDISNINNWNEWVNTYEDEIEDIIKNYLPHGSGIDNGVSFDYENSKPDKLVFNSSYHAMNEHGYYDGWYDFKVIITPCLELDYSIKIKGSFGKYWHVKDYLYEIFDYSFNTEYVKGGV